MALQYLEQVLHVSSFTIITTSIVILLGIFYLLLKDRGLPPGPAGLPLVGYWPFLKNDAVHLQLHELMRKYGEVFSFSVAGKLFIHLGSIKALKEAHIKRSDCFSQRFADYNVLNIYFGKGIATVNGEEWKALRKFFGQAFKEYGILSLKNYMTGSIYDAVNTTVESLRAAGGSPVNIVSILNVRSLSILRRMMFNDGDITEQEIQGILDAYGKVLNIITGNASFLVGDFARKYLYPRIDGFEEALECHKVMQGYVRKIIKRHEETFDNDHIRDIIDSYIKERKDRISKGDPTAEYFSDDSLAGSLIEFVGDGILFVAIFLAYFIDALLEYPEEQDKIYKELIDIVGVDREVTLEDRNNLPYTNAFIQEVNRTMDFFTFVSSLECTKETTINGFRIPVGSITVTNFWSSQRDPAVFEDPEAFKPSRYMAEPGKPKAEPPVLFGVGKRSCIGESFVMMQVFLFLTTIVKNFKLARPEGEVKRSFLDGQMNICAYPRN